MTDQALYTHLRGGVTHTCHCWLVRRRDGVTLGFTDHDGDLAFDGMTFAPQSGLSARAIASSSGLSVNNTEAIGVLSDDAITEADIIAGRYDSAEVTVWLVCWDDVAARKVLFRGTLGEITHGAGGFEAELQGLTEALNTSQGRSYLKTCSASLGDARCKFAVGQAAYQVAGTVDQTSDGQELTVQGLGAFAQGWFEAGLVEVLTGAAAGLQGTIKSDLGGDRRTLTLWAPLNAQVVVGDTLRITAGCDKRLTTCREKFGNLINFQGFPDMPGDDWMVSVPRSGNANTGGSLTR